MGLIGAYGDTKWTFFKSDRPIRAPSAKDGMLRTESGASADIFAKIKPPVRSSRPFLDPFGVRSTQTEPNNSCSPV